jgi:uncharacterized protein YqeY
MSLEEKLLTDMTAAMKAGNKEELSTLRLIRAQIKNASIQKGDDLSDTEVEDVLLKSAKARKESIDLYEQGNRQDLADKEKNELKIISRYLPEQLSEDQIVSLIQETISSLNLSSDKDVGRLMGDLMPKVKGKADGKIVQQLARTALLNLIK